MVPKIPPMPYRKVVRLLKAHGLVPVRQVGSHVVFQSLDGRTTVVPRHAGDIYPNLLAGILKQAGIDPDEIRR